MSRVWPCVPLIRSARTDESSQSNSLTHLAFLAAEMGIVGIHAEAAFAG